MKKITICILVVWCYFNNISAQTFQQCNADNNNDGITDTQDFLNLVGQFGQNCTPIGTLSSFTFTEVTNNGTLLQGNEAINVSSIFSYTGGNGGYYNGQLVNSTGVEGLYALLTEGSFTSGAGSLTYLIFGTPDTSGTASFALNIGGQNYNLTLIVNSSGSGPINIETAYIPAGTFTMGSPTTEAFRGADEVQHQVTLSAYRMSTYETSNAQFAAFLNAKSIGSDGLYALGAFPSQPLICAYSPWGLNWTGSEWQPNAGYEIFPAVNATWFGATEFATYVGGRLPTEAEWEYACRAGTTTPFNTGNCLNEQANYFWLVLHTDCSNSSTTYPNQTQVINSYYPNAFGLYNMHGNVSEWCADWFGSYFTTAQTNPTGASTGTFRVTRGGDWSLRASSNRSAVRFYLTPGDCVSSDTGFRVAFAP